MGGGGILVGTYSLFPLSLRDHSEIYVGDFLKAQLTYKRRDFVRLPIMVVANLNLTALALGDLLSQFVRDLANYTQLWLDRVGEHWTGMHQTNIHYAHVPRRDNKLD